MQTNALLFKCGLKKILFLLVMNRLKRTLALFLILVIIFPGETTHAFTFVPEFIAHYEHHNAEHHELSFVDFIGEHFGVGHHKDMHHHEQDDCPMHHDHVLVSLTFVLENGTSFESAPETHLFPASKNPLPPYRFIFSEFHTAIWQPPKIG